jgi:phosphopantetheinyl transferase (holo-ACP synthase)
MQRTGIRGRFRMSLKFKPIVKIPTPSLPDKKNSNKIVKKILGNKLAPSYRIIIGSGKKVKTLGGRYSAKDAISKGAYIIDRSKQRTVRIVPTKQKPNSKFNLDYLKQAQNKFRNYRIQKGQKVRFSSTRLIEKRKFFNDFKGEVKRKR